MEDMNLMSLNFKVLFVLFIRRTIFSSVALLEFSNIKKGKVKNKTKTKANNMDMNVEMWKKKELVLLEFWWHFVSLYCKSVYNAKTWNDFC